MEEFIPSKADQQWLNAQPLYFVDDEPTGEIPGSCPNYEFDQTPYYVDDDTRRARIDADFRAGLITQDEAYSELAQIEAEDLRASLITPAWI